MPYFASDRTFTPRLQAAPTSRTTTTSAPSAVSWEEGPPEPRLMRQLLLAAPARGVVLRVCVCDRILSSLDVAVGLWPLLREGLRSSRLRPGALTRPCAS